MVFFSNFGVAYTSRIVDVPASTGYGEPVQKLFKFDDQERVIGVLVMQSRSRGRFGPADIRLLEAFAARVREGLEEAGVVGRIGKQVSGFGKAFGVR
jgi:DNA gyrase/topoisomerase IV subunit A